MLPNVIRTRQNHPLPIGVYAVGAKYRGICGRADNVLSQIILDSTAAADQIPKYAKGRFLLHDGTAFQSYLLGEDGL